MATEVMSHETMTDEQIARRMASDHTELQRRFAQQRKDQESKQKAMIESALSASANGTKKRGRKPTNVDAD